MKNLLFSIFALLLIYSCGTSNAAKGTATAKSTETVASKSPNHLKYFGEINLERTPFDDDVAITVNGDDALIDLRFSARTTTTEKLQPAARFIENLDAMETKARAFIAADIETGDQVKMYLLDQYMQMKDEHFKAIGMAKDASPKQNIDKLLAQFNLWRVAVSPDGADTDVLFQYSFINREFSTRTVNVRVDASGELIEVTAYK